VEGLRGVEEVKELREVEEHTWRTRWFLHPPTLPDPSRLSDLPGLPSLPSFQAAQIN